MGIHMEARAPLTTGVNFERIYHFERICKLLQCYKIIVRYVV